MRTSGRTSIVFPLAVVVAIVFAIIMAGCAVDHLKVSMDRGAISPKVESSWLDHMDGSTNTP